MREQSFDCWHTLTFQELDRLVKLTHPKLPEKNHFLSAAFSIDPDVQPEWTASEAFRVGSSEGILRKKIFLMLELAQAQLMDELVDETAPVPTHKSGGRGSGGSHPGWVKDRRNDSGSEPGASDEITNTYGAGERGAGKETKPRDGKVRYPHEGCGLTQLEEARYKQHAPRDPESDKLKCVKSNLHAGCNLP